MYKKILPKSGIFLFCEILAFYSVPFNSNQNLLLTSYYVVTIVYILFSP
ncbi:hypothetical protein SAMN05421636_108102 [Pricia antarctica]|uniref:Uncharacterized protein n=1 Tax=Pricia antarctica TaxID=641691 RepID=A0A1G7GE94_9FLAO|nr:hypothetical protein SAMN05421636_108102 [Pricia antarctica]